MRIAILIVRFFNDAAIMAVRELFIHSRMRIRPNLMYMMFSVWSFRPICHRPYRRRGKLLLLFPARCDGDADLF
jgi:hypothetical protein